MNPLELIPLAFSRLAAAKMRAALTMLGQCTDPAQAFEAQMRYAREAMADYYEEGQRMMGLMRDVATESGLPMAKAFAD